MRRIFQPRRYIAKTATPVGRVLPVYVGRALELAQFARRVGARGGPTTPDC